jgi:8-oxo-dGTP pyrophosphatase MutT (NUDIX family)
VTPRVPVPRFLGVLAAEVASRKRAVAEPRDAATVVLLRPAVAGGGLEVLLLCRGRTMDFAPGAHVFPGGSVDPRDGELDGFPAAELSGVLGVTADRCRAIVGAAVRETFEECGVLLAGTGTGDGPGHGSGHGHGPAHGPPDPADRADRAALLAGTDALADVLGRRRLALGADVLIPWARWVTPEVSDRRYDTWFFVAAMPEGQVADAGLNTAGPGSEADSAAWLRPEEALDAARRGEMTLLPPTAVTLAELASFASVAGVLAQRRTIEPRMPTVLVDDDGDGGGDGGDGDGQVWLVMPEGVEYPL